MKIKLKYPIQFEGAEIGELEFRRIKTGELRRATKNAKGEELQMAVEVTAISAGLPVEAIDELDAADFKAIGEALAEAGFFEHTT